MSCWWISWYETADDHRPLTFPPPREILGWWCTGERQSDGAKTLCAVVDAEDQGMAEVNVIASWPLGLSERDKEWRFCEPWDHRLSDRFPLADWMEPRFMDRLNKEKP